MTTKQHTDFEQLLLFLFRKQKAAWRSEPKNGIAKRTRNRLEQFGKWRFADEKALKGLPLGDDARTTNFANGKLIVPLLPLKKNVDFVPVMSVEYHPNASFHKACLRIRVLMIRQTGDDLVGIGFRIESPEGHCQQKPDEGIHDFYHAQLIKEIGYGPRFETPDWLPCTQPSFPLWAVNPIDAVLNLILTLYGRKFYKDFLASMNPKIQMSEEFRLLNEKLNKKNV